MIYPNCTRCIVSDEASQKVVVRCDKERGAAGSDLCQNNSFSNYFLAKNSENGSLCFWKKEQKRGRNKKLVSGPTFFEFRSIPLLLESIPRHGTLELVALWSTQRLTLKTVSNARFGM